MTILRAAVLAFLLSVGARAAEAPVDPASLAWQTDPGAQAPLNAELHDESGKNFQLSEAFGAVPVILDLGYFHCPSLCGLVRGDLLNALRGSGMVEGRDYKLVSVSIDPAETPADAAQAKAHDLTEAPFATGAGWHYLTGNTQDVAPLMKAVGFRDRYDPVFKQFIHPAGLVVLTKRGIVSGYLLGVGYSGGDLRAAVLRAGTGGVARAALPVLLLCFHFDSSTGRYTLEIEKLLRLFALLTVVTIAGLLVVLHRHRARLP